MGTAEIKRMTQRLIIPTYVSFAGLTNKNMVWKILQMWYYGADIVVERNKEQESMVVEFLRVE